MSMIIEKTCANCGNSMCFAHEYGCEHCNGFEFEEKVIVMTKEEKESIVEQIEWNGIWHGLKDKDSLSDIKDKKFHELRDKFETSARNIIKKEKYHVSIR